MKLHPAVVVHGLEHARAALAPGLPLTLLSGPGAALYGGCLWWRGLVARASAAYPGTSVQDVLDCTDALGRALAAIRAGQRAFILAPECPGFAAVSAIASQRGLLLLTERPPALDLAEPDAVRKLESWLAQRDSGTALS